MDMIGIKSINNNINSLLSNSIKSIQELTKKHHDIEGQVQQIQTINTDSKLDVPSLINNSIESVQDLTAKHAILEDKISEINKTIVNFHKPRPLDPAVSNTISSMIGNLNTLSRKHSELANHVSSLNVKQQVITPNNTSNTSNTSSELFNARLKKIEDLLNLS